MKQQQRYTLGKNERLKSRKAIDQLFTEGKSFSLFPFRIVYQKEAADIQNPNRKRQTVNDIRSPLQAAFSVSKRSFKKAVDRNRVKRLMREAYRLQKNELQDLVVQQKQQLDVFILYTGNEIPEYQLAMEKMKAVIKRLQKIASEETVANT